VLTVADIDATVDFALGTLAERLLTRSVRLARMILDPGRMNGGE
jgi:hypothetical protein